MTKKDISLIIILTIVFTIIIFLIKSYYFKSVENLAEEQYVDKSLFLDLKVSDKKKDNKINTYTWQINFTDTKTLTWITETFNKKENFSFKYVPETLKKETTLQTYIIKRVLLTSFMNTLIDNVWVELNKDTYDVRWKMKNWTVKLFWVLNLDKTELFAVFTHELAHYIDIYNLDSFSLTEVDPSYKFYNIAWESTKVVKASLTQKDFVSWYSMTNKYEDFAESFAYYVLHNKDFYEKTKKSTILKQKYNFFWKYIFKNKEFVWIDLWNGDKIKDYYRDITKIGVNMEKILQYFKLSI